MTPTRKNPDRPPRARYQEVKDYVLDGIRSGRWRPGDRVPSEHQIVGTIGVSRATANRALRELAQEGHLVRLHGAGTFVRENRPPMAFLAVRNIADEIAGWGGAHRAEVHLLREERAGGALAAAMGLSDGQPVYRSVIVHKDGDRPVQLSDRFVNPAVAPDYLRQDFTRITPNAYLTRIAPIQEAEHVVEAVLPDPRAQRLLRIAAGEPCLLLHRRTWSFGLVATKARLLHPGSRYRLGGRFAVRSDIPSPAAGSLVPPPS
jgi:GntR family histidine utilization transcriptional repressor